MKNIQQHENKITRLCLTGSGIVCGLDICVDEDFSILIQAGNGITSNGQYIEVQHAKWYRYYRPYKVLAYPLFQELDIWELMEDHEGGEPLKPQSSDEEFSPFLRDKVVLLYLEEGGEYGEEQVIPLLIDQEQLLSKLNLKQLATQILWEQQSDDDDFIYGDEYNPDDTRPSIDNLNSAFNPALRLPEIYLRRFGFGKGDPFDCPPEGADTSEFPCFKKTDEYTDEIVENTEVLVELFNAYVPIIDEALDKLDKALNQLFNGFGTLLDWNKNSSVQSWIDLLCEKWETYKQSNEENDPGTKHYIQYFYDWTRDLIQAYNEEVQALRALVAACCTHEDRHSNHLFLGIALRDDLARQPMPFRHTLVQPPIYNSNYNRLQRTRLYGWRILMMIKEFYLPDYILDKRINPYCEPNTIDKEDLPDFSKIKITPGKFYDSKLENQSIPFYYPVSWSRFSVHHYWNYKRTKTSSTDHLLSYHASDLEDSYTQVLSSIRPLHYSFNSYSFFRIEGHIDKPLQDINTTEKDETIVSPGVWSTLKYLKSKYNLPIYFNHVSLESFSGGEYGFPLEGLLYDSKTMEKYCSWQCKYLGSEHLAGVKKGGTFILITQPQVVDGIEGVPVVIADLSLPCCADDCDIELEPIWKSEESESEKPIENDYGKDLDSASPSKKKKTTKIAGKDQLLAALGRAKKSEKDDLKVIKGIGPSTEKELNKIGIYTYRQVSNINTKIYALLDDRIGKNISDRAKRDQWAKKAKALLKKK